MPDLRQKLISQIRMRSYREGDFTLSSGKKSTFYIDLKATTLHPESADLIGKCAVERMLTQAKSGRDTIDGVGGLTLGADPIATAVSLAAFSQGHTWPAFIVRKEPKSHGTSRFIEGVENLRPGGHLVVVEDVLTTGASSIKAIECLREAGYQVSTVLTIVDREEGGREKLSQMGIQLIALTTLKEVQSAST